MSFYNLLFGKNPLSEIVLKSLGISEGDVPRFRDAYIDSETNLLVIHTRTGGGNREYYESEDSCRENYPEYFDGDNSPNGPWNSDLYALPGFVYSEDDDFDSTYANFFYKIPESFAPIFETLTNIAFGSEQSPADKWQSLIRDLESGQKTPETERALEVSKSLFNSIKDLNT